MASRFGARTVQTPSGEEWRVGRRWMTRGLPRWRKVPVGTATTEAALSTPDFGGMDGPAATLAIVVGAVALAVVVIPLLLFGIELIILGLVIGLAILGRGLLGRPWIVEARRATDTSPTYSWSVSGWRRSRQTIDEVVSSLRAGIDPAPAWAKRS
jgi:hypothetical protein